MVRKLDPHKLTIVAEIGEHPHQWPEMLKMAKWAGADAVKVQLWRASHFPVGEKTQAEEFPREQFREFVQVAHSWDMLAGASVFDPVAVWLGSCGDFLKLATREEHNLRLRLLCFVVGRAREIPVLRSVDVSDKAFWPSPDWPGEIPMGCVPRYPTDAQTNGIGLANLLMLWRGVSGWSSHSGHYADCQIARGFSATVIEKHLCRGKNRNAWSLLPHEFKEMVNALRA